MIKVSNKEVGITEEYSKMNLEFIRRSYSEFSDIDMTEEDYKALALKLTQAKYQGSRYESLEWEISVQAE